LEGAGLSLRVNKEREGSNRRNISTKSFGFEPLVEYFLQTIHNLKADCAGAKTNMRRVLKIFS